MMGSETPQPGLNAKLLVALLAVVVAMGALFVFAVMRGDRAEDAAVEPASPRAAPPRQPELPPSPTGYANQMGGYPSQVGGDPSQAGYASHGSQPAPIAEPLETCDEVSCVVSDYAEACCAKYRKQPPAHAAPADGLPETLTRDLIMQGINPVAPAVRACGDRSSARGKVKVHVQVAPDGHVSDVVLKETPDTDLGACVSARMKTAKFNATHRGGSFTYPFVF